MTVPSAPTITSPASGATVSQPFTLAWNESTEAVVNPPVAAFSFSSEEYAPVSPAPTAAFTFTSELDTTSAPAAGFTFTSV